MNPLSVKPKGSRKRSNNKTRSKNPKIRMVQSRPNHPGEKCTFCEKGGKPIAIYKTHILREHGRVVCPFLRSKVCNFCGATGDNAHLDQYCTRNPKNNPKNILNKIVSDFEKPEPVESLTFKSQSGTNEAKNLSSIISMSNGIEAEAYEYDGDEDESKKETDNLEYGFNHFEEYTSVSQRHDEYNLEDMEDESNLNEGEDNTLKGTTQQVGFDPCEALNHTKKWVEQTVAIPIECMIDPLLYEDRIFEERFIDFMRALEGDYRCKEYAGNYGKENIFFAIELSCQVENQNFSTTVIGCEMEKKKAAWARSDAFSVAGDVLRHQFYQKLGIAKPVDVPVSFDDISYQPAKELAEFARDVQIRLKKVRDQHTCMFCRVPALRRD